MKPSVPPPPTHDEGFIAGRARFEAGASTRGTLPNWVISLTLSGRGSYPHAGHGFLLERNDILLIRPMTPQVWLVPPAQPAGRARGGWWEPVYAIFTPRPHWHPWLRYDPIAPGYMRLTPRDPRMIAVIRREMVRMHEWFNGAGAERIGLCLNALERVLLCCRQDQAPATRTLDERVAAAVDLLSSRLAEPITLAGLARSCHASRSHLAMLFQRQVGVPPMRFLEQQRMERAARMLELTAEPVKRIAAAVGFNDPKHFAKAFRRVRGHTPRRHRRRYHP